ncbi:MAG: bifunctional [glutamate--ammonia ligase]-adenylyl-L-tyrosine phosphorylase/[glutamate--ammonia-ligase] adenylyltransferase [Gammaproteobacteria bacterium]|nr:bifunctional [glutamate--ammonia ligase]-adenylyl-L-tyrosine phosphorylase/[glutamate--ammonia-ligase] adenylyltransferase [Gammaproteobacteria bacterium]
MTGVADKQNLILPDSLAGPVDDWLARNADNKDLGAVWAANPGLLSRLRKVLACSPYVADIIERRPDVFRELVESGRLAQPLNALDVRDWFAVAAVDGPSETEFESRLRWLRHRELVRIVWRDLSGQASVAETLVDLSVVADAAICASIDWAQSELEARHGKPRCEDGSIANIVVLAMGKLGGQELNFSSDVDLIFCFTEHGETDGPRAKSNEEFFRLLTQRVVSVLSKKTRDGFVYRVDIRLRPFGTSGPVAVSLPALENYLAEHGRDWERYAYVKARVINDWNGADDFYEQILRPFVYRRYLDFGVFSSLRDMKLMIEAEVQRKEFQDNVKLGRGGIREIEFIVQTLQLVRGGTISDLRERGLLVALKKLVRPGCLTAEGSAELNEAYGFLRRFENRLQAINDRQTHDIPADETNRARLSVAMNVSGWDQLVPILSSYRDVVSSHFRSIVLHDDESADDSGDGAIVNIFSPDASVSEAEAVLLDLGYAEPGAAVVRLYAFHDSGFYLRLDEAGRQRLLMMMPAVIKAAARQSDSLAALIGVLTIIESIGRRSAYFSLLNENPAALERLVSLCSMSGMLVTQIASHPLLLDELLDQRIFQDPPTREDLVADLSGRLQGDMLDDPEVSRFALRNFQQAATFRVAVTDLSGALPLMRVSDRLTDIAEIVLAGALELGRHELVQRYGTPCCTINGQRREARFAIIAYGKLGGLELGYGSDLDIIFLHDSEGTDQHTDADKPVDNPVFFMRLAQRIIHILTMSTTSGPLYEVDTRLRPNGKSGLLVSSLAAFYRYQRTEAWTWEQQALLRGRPVAGDVPLMTAFEELRSRVLVENVHHDSLQSDVIEMRQRMREGLNGGTDKLFDLKQDLGGVTDIEFIVQYLVLKEACHKPELTVWSDNIRQLETLVSAQILSDSDAELLSSAYRKFRSLMHRQALAGRPRLVPRDEVMELAGKVRDIWDQVFSSA